ncbi:MAG: hypothetical protein QG589_511 [Patescibacteria group bacterium]|nr:hypothetical protein [Patescibacteria group bacterium]
MSSLPIVQSLDQFDELVYKYLIANKRKNEVKFSVNGDRPVLARIFDTCGYQSIFDYLTELVTDHLIYSDFSLDSRVETMELILRELLHHFKNTRRSSEFEQAVGKLICLLSETHNIRFVRHKKVPHR